MSFSVFAQGSPFYAGTQGDRFQLKKNKDDFEVVSYTFMEKYNSIPLKMLRLQDYANIKEGRIMEDHKININKYFQSVRGNKSGMNTLASTTIGATSIFGTASKPSTFGIGGTSTTGTTGGMFGTGTTTGLGTSGNLFGATQSGGNGFTSFGQSTASTNPFGQTAAFGASTGGMSVNAFGMPSGGAGQGINAFGGQASTTPGFGAFGAGTSTNQPAGGFGMFSGGGNNGFGQFGAQPQNNTFGAGNGMFNKPQGYGIAQGWNPQQNYQQPNQFGQQAPQLNFGNPVIQSNLNSLANASAAVTGSGTTKGPYALVYLPIESLNLKKEDSSKAAPTAKKTTETESSQHLSESDYRTARQYSVYEPAVPPKKISLLGENPLLKTEARYSSYMSKSGELSNPMLVTPGYPRKKTTLNLLEPSPQFNESRSSKLFNSPKPTLATPQQSSPILQQSQYMKASPLFSNPSTKASPSADPPTYIEVELATGRTILVPVTQNALLANALKTLLDRDILSSKLSAENVAFFRGREKLALTTPVDDLNLQPGERLLLKQQHVTVKKTLAEPSLVPSLPPGYFSSPSLTVLSLLTETELSEVHSFSVWSEFGKVTFLNPVDLRGMQLHQLIKIERRVVEIYPNDCDKPPLGEGLNVPARIEFYHFGLTCDISDTRAVERIRKRIQEWASKNQASLLSLDILNDTVMIQTEGLPQEPQDRNTRAEDESAD